MITASIVAATAAVICLAYWAGYKRGLKSVRDGYYLAQTQIFRNGAKSMDPDALAAIAEMANVGWLAELNKLPVEDRMNESNATNRSICLQDFEKRIIPAETSETDQAREQRIRTRLSAIWTAYPESKPRM